MDPERSRRYGFLPGAGPGFPIARAEGCFLFTPEGRPILDAAGGAIVCGVGHGRPEVAEAVARTLERCSYVVPPFVTEERVRLVERLQDRWLPGDLHRVMLTSGGSESVDAAIRVARQHFVARGEPGRTKILGRELSYHGTTLAGLAAGGHTKRRKGFEGMLHDWPKAPACYPLRCGLCQGACNLACAEALEAALVAAGPETVAAVILEPIGGSTAGALTPPEGYLPQVAEICRRHGVLLIADEVMTGFGRTGRRFAVDHWDVVPDILVGGKGLASGYAPIGGVYVREEVVAPIAERGDDVMFYTFAAHPASCAAAEVVLDILEREGLVERAEKMGALLRERLEPLAAHPNVAELRGRGLLQAVELVRDKATGEPFPPEARLTGKVVAAGLAEGVFFYPGGSGPAQDVVCLGPPLTLAEADVETLARALEAALESALQRTRGRS